MHTDAEDARSKTDAGADVQNEPSPSAEEAKAASDAKAAAADKDYPEEAKAKVSHGKNGELYSRLLNNNL